MSGKSLICSVLSLLFFCLFFARGYLSSQGGNDFKTNLYVNGYDFSGSIDSRQMLGLRLKARADLYFREKNYASAIKFYEEASSYLPDEADIYYNLGNIYYTRNIYGMSSKYFRIAGEKYLMPENRLKSRQFYYQSTIRYGISLAELSKAGQDNESARKAREIYWKLSDAVNFMTNDFPETGADFSNFNRILYGDITVNKR
jgi:tetratricopeptide (TPR) repeat protein